MLTIFWPIHAFIPNILVWFFNKTTYLQQNPVFVHERSGCNRMNLLLDNAINSAQLFVVYCFNNWEPQLKRIQCRNPSDLASKGDSCPHPPIGMSPLIVWVVMKVYEFACFDHYISELYPKVCLNFTIFQKLLLFCIIIYSDNLLGHQYRFISKLIKRGCQAKLILQYIFQSPQILSFLRLCLTYCSDCA